MSPPVVRLTDLVRRFETEAGSQTVIDGLFWTLDSGAAATIVGASGSGKSTLLQLIGGLDRPSAGTVVVDGVDLGAADDDARARLRAQRVGFVFQDHHLLPQCTALENVLLPLLAQRSTADDADIERARGLLDRVGLGGESHKFPHQLSGGQRQRVAVVRALIHEPVLLLADEPTGSLDREHSEALVDLLLELHRERGLAMVVVTHAREVAERIGGILHLRDGSLFGPDAARTVEPCAPTS